MVRRCAILVCLLLAAAPAAGEVYRWRDVAGREHFAQDLSRVPREHRAAAKAAAEQGGDAADSINYHATTRRAPTSGARAKARRIAQPARAGFNCAHLKKQVRRKQKVIRTHQRSVDANLRLADDIDRSVYSRRRYEVDAEEEGRWLAKAEADLDRFVDAQRRKGAPPGCLR
jgi:hypothetical protein